MESLLEDILNALRSVETLDEKELAQFFYRHNKGLAPDKKHYAKKRLLPYYLTIKENDPERWKRWDIDSELEKRLIKTLRVKPRRSASGVATITVITKPSKCLSDCLYCPNDVRMPKSYLYDEPACQRAEQNFFDPYLQMASRLRALTHMGHSTDKIEVIVLGGTWTEYPEGYQSWFIHELFRALNDGDNIEEEAQKRRHYYKEHGLSNQKEELAKLVQEQQNAVNAGAISYNQAIEELYLNKEPYKRIAHEQQITQNKLILQQTRNEQAANRMVGLVIETRPDTINVEQLNRLRAFGCTKIQIGIQSLDPEILKMNRRNFDIEGLKKSFELLRLFGFKIHAHFMLNLLGSSCETDTRDYHHFVNDPAYIPDEVKLYPCSLVQGTGLCTHYANKSWQPYSEEELVQTLALQMLDTPAFIRISRMIRDISAHDIMVGNKKTNLRQMVEASIENKAGQISEIRYREIATDDIDIESLNFDVITYESKASDEYFLQWITPEDKIAGFLRLSLPKTETLNKYADGLPEEIGHAMIREVHVYGKVSGLHSSEEGAQHLGLGKQLVKKACDIAKAHNYSRINVISSVGTRAYYRSLGFADHKLYQQKTL